MLLGKTEQVGKECKGGRVGTTFVGLTEKAAKEVLFEQSRKLLKLICGLPIGW